MDINALIMQYVVYIIAGFVVIFFVFKMFVKVSGKTKILKRSDIEKKKLINDMKLNKTRVFKELWHGKNFLGKVISYRRSVLNPTNEKIEEMQESIVQKFEKFKKTKDERILKEIDALDKDIENLFSRAVVVVVFKPKLTGKILNPFKKEVIQLSDRILIKEYDKKKLIIPSDVFTEEFMGIYFDMVNPQMHLNIINNKMYETDLDSLASVYYVKSQEQSTFDPEKAHAMAMKEKELQIELARKRGKMTEI